MSERPWMAWTEEAINNIWPDAPAKDLRQQRGQILQDLPGNNSTWWPDNAIKTIVTADDKYRAYAGVIEHTVDAYIRYALAKTGALDEPRDLPDWYITNDELATPEAIIVEMYSLAPQLVKGSLGEILAGDHLVNRGAHIMSDEIAQRFSAFDGDIDEKHGIDLVVVWEDGSVETIQVKSSTGEAGKYNGDADTILIADVESQEVNEY